jgi:hypothetical protein
MVHHRIITCSSTHIYIYKLYSVLVYIYNSDTTLFFVKETIYKLFYIADEFKLINRLWETMHHLKWN